MPFVVWFGMTNMKRMSDRTLEFSAAVVAEFRRVRPADDAEYVLWTELLKTQKGLAANTAESGGAQSRRDFALKFQIALKEAREAMQLLRLLHRICSARQPELTTLIRQCDEITAILVASLKTAKRRAQVQDVLRPRDRRH
jgi:four helix bundle protein